MNIKIIIETERLYLRELDISDKAKLALVLSDPEYMIHYPHAFSDKEVEGWIERNIRRYKEYGFGLWAVIRKSDNEFLGECGITLQNIDSEILPEIGFHIIKQFCKQGYATEAAEACIEYASEKLSYDVIYSYTRSSNIASQKVSQNIGMKIKKKYLKDGIEHVVFEYLF